MVYTELNDYEKALSCLEESIRLDPLNAFPWNNEGNVYYGLKDYDKALSCYEKAIRLDPSFDSPWFNKGQVYANLNKLNEASACYIRYDNLAGSFGWNEYINIIIKFFWDKIDAPLFLLRLLKRYPQYDNLFLWQQMLHGTYKHTKDVSLFIEHLRQSDEPNKNPLRFLKLIGLISYYMGDPPFTFRIFKKIINEIYSDDLMVHYYTVISCFGFCEPHNKYLSQALQSANKLFNSQKMLKQNIFELELYYGGSIFLLSGDYESAMTCFEASKGFLPSLYLKIIALNAMHKNGKKENVIVQVLERERDLQVTGEGFLQGVNIPSMDINPAVYDLSFMKYAHYIEIADAIHEVYKYMEDERVQYTRYQFVETYSTLPPVHLIWKPLQKVRTKLLKSLQLSKSSTLDRLKELLKESFTGNFLSWQKIKKSADLSRQLGEFVYHNDYDSNQLHQLVTFFFYDGKLNVNDKILLHFYIELKKRYTSRARPVIEQLGREAIISACFFTVKRALKDVLPDSLDSIYWNILEISGNTLIEMLIRYLKKKDQFLTFSDFKSDFIGYALELKPALGKQLDIANI